MLEINNTSSEPSIKILLPGLPTASEAPMGQPNQLVAASLTYGN